MQRAKLKLMVRDLKTLVDVLESEVYSDPESYNATTQYQVPITDYEEVYDDDGYPD